MTLLLLPAGALAQETAPRVIVDQGACPFECCHYGPWTASRSTPAFAEPGATKPTLAIPARSAVTALTGYVRTVGTPFVVRRAHGAYKPGDRLMVYTYHGEGEFSVWHKGRRFTEDLGFSPYGGTVGKRCTDREYCWGTLSRELQSEWWVNLRLQNGRTVWVRGAEGFEGADGCG